MADKPEFHVSLLPWVCRLQRRPFGRCEGYRWSQMPIKAVWNRDGSRADPQLKEQYRCKHSGYFRFKALKQKRGSWFSPATTGVYCWQHLWREIYHPYEYERAERWVKRHYSELITE